MTGARAERRSSGVVALTALEELVRTPRGVALTDLARRLEVDPGQLHRALNGLVGSGYAEQDPDTHRYLPTPRIISLASSLLASMDLVAAARHQMIAVRNATGETIHLAQRTRDGAICVARELSPQPVAVTTEVGERFGATTAVARAITGARGSGKSSVTRELGYVTDDGVGRPGVRCAASPVIGWEGEALGVLAVSGPVERIDDHRLAELGRVVAAAAQELSSAFGGVLVGAPQGWVDQ
jgi:DNA-binding IclR family transcriptional regulator